MKLWQWIIALFSSQSKEGLSQELHDMQKEVKEIYQPKRAHKRWSRKELSTLVITWQDMQTLEYIAYSMDRTVHSIRSKLIELGYSTAHDTLRISQYDIAANKTL